MNGTHVAKDEETLSQMGAAEKKLLHQETNHIGSSNGIMVDTSIMALKQYKQDDHFYYAHHISI